MSHTHIWLLQSEDEYCI